VTVRATLGRWRAKLLGFAFRVFDRILPVADDLWCFGSWDRHYHTLDNPRAVFQAVESDPGIRKVVLTWREPGGPVVDSPGTRFVPADSLRGAYFLARSRVVVLGVGLRGLAPFAPDLRGDRHRVIQVWHGIPLKRIGKLFPGETTWDDETPRYTATVCSSEADRDAMAAAFAPLPRDRVWLTGLPRNDFILGPEEDLPPDYRDHLEQVKSEVDGRRLVLYAPTWREDIASLYTFSDHDRDLLGRVLEKHDAVLGIRGHSNVRWATEDASSFRDPRIISLNSIPDVNLVLRETAVLVTDYSSIYIDFLLLDRPVVHFAYDLEAYVAERGFIYEPTDAFAGPNARTAEELAGLLDEALSSPEAFADLRRGPTTLFHSHPGPGAGRRVAREIKKLSDTVQQ
jgi:CDP-glycerol glycerophosphotransferase